MLHFDELWLRRCWSWKPIFQCVSLLQMIYNNKQDTHFARNVLLRSSFRSDFWSYCFMHCNFLLTIRRMVDNFDSGANSASDCESIRDILNSIYSVEKWLRVEKNCMFEWCIYVWIRTNSRKYEKRKTANRSKEWSGNEHEPYLGKLCYCMDVIWKLFSACVYNVVLFIFYVKHTYASIINALRHEKSSIRSSKPILNASIQTNCFTYCFIPLPHFFVVVFIWSFWT